MLSCNNDTSDYQSPSLALLGDVVVTLSLNTPYEEPGYVALDDIDGNITDQVWTETELNTDVAEKYRILYNVKDAAGNWAVSAIRTIIVQNDAKALANSYSGQYSSNNGETGNYQMTLRVSPTENNVIRFSSFGDSPVPQRVDVVGTVVEDSIIVDLQYIDGYWYMGNGVITDETINFQSFTGIDKNQLVECQVEYTPLPE